DAAAADRRGQAGNPHLGAGTAGDPGDAAGEGMRRFHIIGGEGVEAATRRLAAERVWRYSTKPSTLVEPQCQNIEWRSNEGTNAIRQDLAVRIAAADFATIAQAGAAHP